MVVFQHVHVSSPLPMGMISKVAISLKRSVYMTTNQLSLENKTPAISLPEKTQTLTERTAFKFSFQL